jgi:hypothetical protein
MRHNKRKKQVGPYKSGLERLFVKLAGESKLDFQYEIQTFSYIIPSHYTPDFLIAPNKFIETKGYLSPSNRMRLLCFKEQHPDVEILLLFGNWDNKISSRSKTTYKEWAEGHGFRCADIKDGIPVSWFKNKKKAAPLCKLFDSKK